MILEKQILEDFIGERLDKSIFIILKNYSRTEVQGFIKNGFIKVNNCTVKPSYIISSSDLILVELANPKNEIIVKENLNIDLIFENMDFFIVNKPSGVLTHLDSKYKTNTLINTFIDKIKISDFEDKKRPGIVHRLDKDTSGLILITKNLKAYNYFVDIFKERKIEKKYYTLVLGLMEHKKGIIDSPITRDIKNRKKMGVSVDKKAKNAITEYEVIDEFEFKGQCFSFLDITLKTGRTHQIRVHMSAISHPVFGDYLYGNKKINDKFKKELNRMFLQAYSLKFNERKSNNEMVFNIDIDNDLKQFLDKCVKI